MPELDRHVVIVGMMAAGKTTLGRSLAGRLAVPYVDSDDAIVARFGKSGRELAASRGVAWLHRLEAEILAEQLADPAPSVISAAASTVDSPECVEMLKGRLHVCWVDVPVSAIAARAGIGDHRRPMDTAELHNRWERRRRVFESIARIRTDGTESVDAQVSTVIDTLSKCGSGQ